MTRPSADGRPRWWSWSWRPGTIRHAVLAEVLVFVALVAFGRLLDGEVRDDRVGFAAAFAGVRLVLDLRALHRERTG